jgi:HK97 gp10 family phage protein|tara:strand:+ start:5665 stop:6111 length:447 start_codon:yes stop_codon:yes gene_type:complete
MTANRVKFTVVNQNAFDAKIKKQSENVLKNLVKAVRVATTETRNVAVTSILSNARSGASTTRYNPTRTINISSPGDAPAGDTGFLASNIHLIISGNGLEGEVQSRADYSAALEFGTRDMAARPFLQPALEQGKNKYKRLFSKAVKDGI